MKTNRFKPLAQLGFCLVTLVSIPAYAVERTFTGGAATEETNLWSYEGNWADNAVPGSGDSLVFTGNPANRTSNTNDFAAGTEFTGIYFDASHYHLRGNAIKLTGDLWRTADNGATIYFPVEIAGNLTFRVDGTSILGFRPDAVLSGSGGIIKTGTGKIEFFVSNSFSGGMTVEDGSIATRGGEKPYLFGTGTLTVNGGTVILSAGGTSVNALAGSAAGIVENGGEGMGALNRTFTINTTSLTGHTFAGTIRNGGEATLALTKDGVGLSVLSGTNTYTGATTVNAGTLQIDGSLGNTLVTINTNGTLSGSGSIAGATTVNGTLDAGTLSFGGNLTFGTAGARTLLFEGGDRVMVAGILEFNNNWTLSLQGGLQDGGSVVLFDYGTMGGLGTVNIDTSGLGFTPSGVLTIFNDTENRQIVLQGISAAAIPEPSALLLTGFGVAGMFMLARWRRQKAQA